MMSALATPNPDGKRHKNVTASRRFKRTKEQAANRPATPRIAAPDAQRHFMRKVTLERPLSNWPGSLRGPEDQLSLMCCTECEKVSFQERPQIHARVFGRNAEVKMYPLAEVMVDERERGRIPCSWCGRTESPIEAKANIA